AEKTDTATEKTDAATTEKNGDGSATEKTDAATTEKTDAATTEKTGDGSATKKTDAATTEKTGDGSAAEKTDTATTEKTDAATTEKTDTATEKTDAATTEKNGDGSATEKTDAATTEKTDAATSEETDGAAAGVAETTSSLPMLFHVQAGGGGWTLNGISPLSATFSARALFYLRGGFWERYGVGLGVDVGFQGASGSLGVNRESQWNTWMGKVRIEGEAVLLDKKRARSMLGSMLPVDVEMGILLGAGAAFGNHDVSVGNLQKSDAFFGPTFRLGAFAGVGLGPGALTFTVPLDVSVPFSSEVSGFLPIEGALLVGYRLDL
ncbi:MAG: hypothetical protein GY822_10525, partial [Deltaproteobacteria bacterium]|nr:hypothetical protein [Deltaproteobacteria bacterium]